MLSVMEGNATPTAVVSPLGHDEVDQPMDGLVETEKEVVTEFLDESSGENASLKRVGSSHVHGCKVATLYLTHGVKLVYYITSMQHNMYKCTRLE